MLRKIEGVYFGDLNGKRVVIIDVDVADKNALKIVNDLIKERRLHDGRRNNQRMIKDQKDVQL